MSNPVARLPRWIAVTALVVVTLGLTACSSASAPAYPAGGGQPGVGQPAGGGTGGVAGDGSGAGGAGGARNPAASPGSGDGGGSNLSDINVADLLIIKTGTMSLQVADLDEALATASQKLAGLGAYLAGSNRHGSDDRATASVTYRIPAARWDDALVAMRGLAAKVLDEQSQSQDVTGQVVDLTARISNLQATEQAVQAIMARATKISDVLEIQAQLTEIRGQIERAQAERKHLQEQAAYSTLTVNMSLKPAQAVEETKKGFDPADEVDQASATLVGLLQGLETAGIWLGIVWLPILAALVAVTAAVLIVVRRVAPVRRDDPPLESPPAATA
jgi:uncharacterized protein DUF4349